MHRKLSVHHYIVISFSVAALALLGEAMSTLFKGPLQPGEGTATSALVIAPSRTASRR